MWRSRKRHRMTGEQSQMKHFVLWTVFAVTITVTASSARAQTSERYPKGRLIDGLVERGMTTLLEHLVATDPPDDPTEAVELIYRVHLSRWEDPDLEFPMRVQELAHAEQRMRGLIKAHRDHESRPIWQTDLAGVLLFARLDTANVAGLFYEFGVPTAKQRLAVDRNAAEALEQLSDALQRLFVLQGELPKQKDHVQTRVNTGRWDRLMNRYFELRTRFYTGQACLYAALLADDHPFYQSLDKPEARLQMRGKTIAAERSRVVRKGIENLEDFIANDQDPYGIYASSLSLTARLLLIDEKPDESLRRLQSLSKLSNLPPVTDLVMQMAIARAVHRKGRRTEAIERLEELRRHRLAREDPLIRLLVVDCTHRLLMAEAESAAEGSRRDAVRLAYGVYDALMNDRSLGARSADLRSYIYRRWTAGIKPGQDLTALPPKVLRAAGSLSAQEADDLLDQSMATQDPKQRRELGDRAAAKYQGAIEVSRELLQRDAISAEDEAEAHYVLALATYRAGGGDRSKTVEAVRRWTDLAGRQPNQEVAERAISHAVKLARPLLLDAPDDKDVQQLYERATSILFDQFPRITAADEERVHYAQNVLMAHDRFEQALKMLDGVNLGDGNTAIYYAAQSEVLYCLKRMIETSDGSGLSKLASQLRDRVGRLKRDVESNGGGEPEPLAAKTVATALAHAHAAMAALLMKEGDHEAAAEQLRLVEGLDVPTPVRHAARGDLIGSLAKLGRYDQLQEEAKRLMDTAPGDAAPVIYNVLNQIGQQTEALRRDALMPQTPQERRRKLLEDSQASAGAAVILAQLLLEWARQQPAMNQTRIDEFRIVEAKAKTVAGMPDAAVETLNQIRQQPQFANDLTLLDALADAHFQAGVRHRDRQSVDGQSVVDDRQRGSLIASANVLNMILNGVEPYDDGKYPAEWWQAWVKRLQINDILGQDTQDIPFRIKQLRLTDPMLGGEPFRSQLQRLENKHKLGS